MLLLRLALVVLLTTAGEKTILRRANMCPKLVAPPWRHAQLAHEDLDTGIVEACLAAEAVTPLRPTREEEVPGAGVLWPEVVERVRLNLHRRVGHQAKDSKLLVEVIRVGLGILILVVQLAARQQARSFR
ncbi:MAG TPA: hypothetical protein VIL30_17985 [Ramlibacter sp.]